MQLPVALSLACVGQGINAGSWISFLILNGTRLPAAFSLACTDHGKNNWRSHPIWYCLWDYKNGLSNCRSISLVFKQTSALTSSQNLLTIKSINLKNCQSLYCGLLRVKLETKEPWLAPLVVPLVVIVVTDKTVEIASKKSRNIFELKKCWNCWSSSLQNGIGICIISYWQEHCYVNLSTQKYWIMGF